MQEQEPPMLSVKDIAAKLNVPIPMVWHLIRTGEIPAHRIGKYYRVAPVDFENYLRRTRTTREEEGEVELLLAG